ncbi:MAG: bifunctional riboflavin kinase/FAD synthetase [Ideonella sp.]|nr:bifunctional riboflavin kinase/FAD synthetase [Ideonella sp.]MCC7457312.1 bifunctional riboflavin kinase/FAD synthetase [Nitrospira sp.]
MRVFSGFRHPGLAPQCALTIGNFDGVHRGHQAMLALLTNEARHRGLASCVLTFEPHPRDFFAALAAKTEATARPPAGPPLTPAGGGTGPGAPGADIAAPRRIATLRDKLSELERCGVEQTVVLRFGPQLSRLSAQAFVDDVLVAGVRARYVLVGDDFRFGAKRAGDYAMLDSAGVTRGFDVARMMSYEVHGTRVSSSAVRAALAAGDMDLAGALLGRPYSISGHVQHGRKLGRTLGFPTLNLRFGHPRPAATGIFVVRVHGLGAQPLAGVANLGTRPTVDDAARVLLEVYCLDWPAQLGNDAGYGRVVRVDLLAKLHDELRYPSIDALREGIARDVERARGWFAGRAG